MRATWDKDAVAVAAGIDDVHLETSILTYNNENSLSCIIALAYYSAKTYYNEFRELPSGKGYADIVFLPKHQYSYKPAMIVELKWDKSAEGAIEQIRNRRYADGLGGYAGKMLLVGINYNKRNKVHECVIEER